ncbi:DUF971 domain-containing protein [Rheinheimera sp. MMS21-TC3]|uniref:DUF971 domain-containing protein n=1 Tax=Rheinheimera sp. MMS21-TC3 TaxID=3072790 RepID=UPI0028C4CBCC|nr:DUF971 domain-containing protein [Rheinheimera sp. MMS21-TC3]WNO60470.1 DUF971 domain-containing protein [Rheinheimera sp. MMS21-TC3]
MNQSEIQVTRLHYHKQSRVLDIQFSDQSQTSLTAEFLRVFSPSAEVRRHGNPVLVTNKKQVNIKQLSAVGQYAVKLVFDDGHNTGIYSWQYLHQLATNQTVLWQDYLQQLSAANANREASIAIKFKPF